MAIEHEARAGPLRTPLEIRFPPFLQRLRHAWGRRLWRYAGAGITLLLLSGLGLGLAAVLGLLGSTAPRTIRIPSGAVDVAVGRGAVWVSGFGTMRRLDPETGHVVATVKTPGTEDYSQIAVGAGAVWVTADRGRLERIDPDSNRVVATVMVGGSILGVEAGGGYVWVTRPMEGVGELVRVDPATNRVSGTPINVGPGPTAVVYAFGALWVTNTSPASVVRVDPSTRSVQVTRLEGRIAAGYGSLWVASDDSVVRADPKTGRPTATIGISHAQAVAIGQHRVWLLASSSPTPSNPAKRTGAIWEIDPASNHIVGKPVRLEALQPIALAVGAGAVWVADYDSGTISRIER